MTRCSRVLLGVLALGARATACGDDEPASADADNGFVGPVDGTNAFIAIVVGDDHTVAYVCDGDAEINEYDDTEVTAGWILDNSGEQRGAARRKSRFERTRLENRGAVIGETRVAVARIGTTNGRIVPNNVTVPPAAAIPDVVKSPQPPAPFVPIPLPN